MNSIYKAFNQVTSRDNLKVAALDLGSNSFHLVIARIVANDVQILHRVKQKVRLAQGLDENNNLNDGAMERGLTALKSVAENLKGFAPQEVRIVATNTLRRAKNTKQFIAKAKTILPYPIEIIAGAEEARLIYQGVAHTNENKGHKLVIDIGGGSTEFIIGEEFKPIILRSLQLGCVTYSNRHFSSGTITTKGFKKAITAAEQELEVIEKKFLNTGWQHVIGTSGTIRAISRIAEHFNWEERNDIISQNTLHKLKDMCIDAGHIDQLNLPNVSEDRLQVLPAGLAILIGIFERLGITEMHYSASALREGVLYEMEDRLAHKDIRERTANSLATRYDVDTEQAKRVLATTLHLYKQIAKEWKIQHDEYRNLIAWAALLHEIGLQINSRGVQKHSAYILLHAEMPGFNQEQQSLLATLVKYHRKKIRLNELEEFSNVPQQDIFKLISLLRLGVLLNLKRQDSDIESIRVKYDKNSAKQDNKKNLHLIFKQNDFTQDPLFIADLESESERLLSLNTKLTFDINT
jgi:exopolyphosphatase/guanosine-5'-triphosphate,3'-diphosphate pyrophosphatase